MEGEGGFDPNKNCVLCRQPLPPYGIGMDKRQRAYRAHYKVAHPELDQALTDYEVRAKRILGLVLGGWFAAFLFVFLLASPPRISSVLGVLDVLIVLIVVVPAALYFNPTWQKFRALLRAIPSKCRVCDAPITVAGEMDHMRQFHPPAYRVMQALPWMIGAVFASLLIPLVVVVHLSLLDLVPTSSVDIFFLWAMAAFVVLTAGLSVEGFILGPRRLRRMRAAWQTSHFTQGRI